MLKELDLKTRDAAILQHIVSMSSVDGVGSAGSAPAGRGSTAEVGRGKPGAGSAAASTGTADGGRTGSPAGGGIHASPRSSPMKDGVAQLADGGATAGLKRVSGLVDGERDGGGTE